MNVKIVHITKMKGVSGSENHLLTLLAGLYAAEFDVHLCILAEPRHLALLQAYEQRAKQAGIKVSVVPMRRHLDIGLAWTLRTFLHQEKFHIVHTHLIHADLYGTLAAKLAGGPVIVSSRHNDDRFRKLRPLIWLNRLLAGRHERVIVISDWIGRFLQEVEHIPARKIVRIHYGLDPAEIEAQADAQYAREQFQIPAHVPLIGTIGRLTAQKGQRYLLQALARVKPELPEIRLLLVGDGELRGDLERQTRALNLEPNVIFTGYRPDALKLLSGFDFFVFPSLWEGFGLVLLEAMALRKAVVASRVSAIPESVADGETGLLAPPQDADALAEAMLALLRDPARCQQMGEAGYQRLQTHFSTSKMVNATAQLYRQVRETGERRA